MSVAREQLLDDVADMVPTFPAPQCVRVAVDGVGDFHHRRAARHRRGRDSPEGFWLDSYDYEALVHNVLEPFGLGGSRRYRPAVHDLRTDEVLDLARRTAAPGTVLIVDGLFLHRDELVEFWDFSVFLDAPFAVTVARMARRDGSHPDPEHPSISRYVGGQRLYFAACAPHERADVVIDNQDVTRPVLAKVSIGRRSSR